MKANINEFGNYLNSVGFYVEIDKSELWAQEWLAEHSFRDVLDLFNNFQEYLEEIKKVSVEGLR